MATVEASKDFYGGGVTLYLSTRKVAGGYHFDGESCARVHLDGKEAGKLAERLAELGFGPKSFCEEKVLPVREKPKGIGELSELEYLRSLVLELSRK